MTPRRRGRCGRSRPAGAPNVVYVVLDDVGYAQLGCYGSIIDTPNIDALAAQGVRLANFHTAALCSPTRSCLLTGRNHHTNGMGRVADLAMGFPGYWGVVPPENGFLSEILRTHGYSTYAVGKWHLTPDDETHMAADRSSWPLGRGFDRWYGFHGGETHQFVPTLYCDNHSVQPPRTPAEGYHLTEDLVDHAVEYLSDLRNADGEQPFFLYFATGACHSPHHAPPEWIERYRGVFDEGWDVERERILARQIELGVVAPDTELSPRPPWVPAWDELDPADQKVAARFMECFAGFLSHTDDQIGRLLAHLEASGDADNTVVVLVSDNGASSEGGVTGSINDVRMVNRDPASRSELRERIDEIGGPSLHNNYPWGWTMAGNTPFKRWKREVHEGGVADPCIVRWPARFAGDAGSLRHQFAHAIDVLPTMLDLIGVDAPDRIRGQEQSPVHGTSFAYLFADDGASCTGPPHHAALRDARIACAVRGRLEGGDVQAARTDHRGHRLEHVHGAVRRRRVGAVPRRRRSVGGARPRRPGTRATGAHDRHVVGGGGALPRAPARQPHPLHDPQPATEQDPRPHPVPLRAVRRAGAREHRGRRAQPFARDHRVGAGRRRRCSGGGAARDRLRARRLVAARARRPAPLRAQPLREDDRRHRVRPRRSGRASTRSVFATRSSTTKAARPSCSSTARSSGAARSRSSHRSRTTTPAPG